VKNNKNQQEIWSIAGHGTGKEIKKSGRKRESMKARKSSTSRKWIALATGEKHRKGTDESSAKTKSFQG